MTKMIFVNLPVADVARSTAFYEAIGATNNPQYTDDTAACMVFSDTIHVMLLTHDKFAQFTPKRIADAHATSEVLIAISADSREAVDEIEDFVDEFDLKYRRVDGYSIKERLKEARAAAENATRSRDAFSAGDREP